MRAWEEVIGELRKISSDNNFVYLKISDKLLSFSRDSSEVNYIQEVLDDSFIGRKIGILRTNLQGKPIRFRLVD